MRNIAWNDTHNTKEMTNKNIPVFSMKPRHKMLYNTIVYLTQIFMINRTKVFFKKRREKVGPTDIKNNMCTNYKNRQQFPETIVDYLRTSEEL